MTRRLLGPIALLQVQRLPLKAAAGRYDPGPLLPVGRAMVGPEGVAGYHEGAWVLDAHHAAHPAGRADPSRAVSLGFTGHYRLMAARFGPVARAGVGGENILVEAGGRFHLKDLLGTVVIRGPAGEVELTGVAVALPCLGFTSFLLGLDRVAEQHEATEPLEFLGGGLRGFVLGVKPGTRPTEIRLGDEVWWRPDP